MRDISHQHQGGFTLIELMLVLFIIALMSTMVGLSISGADAPARKERDHLIFTLDEARDYAVLNGHLLRMRPNASGDGYEFAERRTRFEPVPQTSSYIKPLRAPAPLRKLYWDSEIPNQALQSHKVIEGVKLEFEGVDGRGTIFIAPSGDLQMGIVRISDDDQTYDVYVDEEGTIIAKLIEKEANDG